MSGRRKPRSTGPRARTPRMCRRTPSHRSPALAGLLQTRAGLLSNWAVSSRGKDEYSRPPRTTKRQLSPMATACQESGRESSGATPMVSPKLRTSADRRFEATGVNRMLGDAAYRQQVGVE